MEQLTLSKFERELSVVGNGFRPAFRNSSIVSSTSESYISCSQSGVVVSAQRSESSKKVINNSVLPLSLGVSPSLNFNEALVYAHGEIEAKGYDQDFTFSELFAGVNLSFNRRKIANITNILRREELIVAKGYRRTISCGREGGAAVAWLRVEQ